MSETSCIIGMSVNWPDWFLICTWPMVVALHERQRVEDDTVYPVIFDHFEQAFHDRIPAIRLCLFMALRKAKEGSPG